MKVIYAKTLGEKIQEAVLKADKEGRKIEKNTCNL